MDEKCGHAAIISYSLSVYTIQCHSMPLTCKLHSVTVDTHIETQLIKKWVKHVCWWQKRMQRTSCNHTISEHQIWVPFGGLIWRMAITWMHRMHSTIFTHLGALWIENISVVAFAAILASNMRNTCWRSWSKNFVSWHWHSIKTCSLHREIFSKQYSTDNLFEIWTIY